MAQPKQHPIIWDVIDVNQTEGNLAMARWRLAAPHYLNVEGTSWEYKEVDRTSGRQKRTIFPVPLHLDPDNPGDWNIVRGKDDGEIIVADRETPENPKDI